MLLQYSYCHNSFCICMCLQITESYWYFCDEICMRSSQIPEEVRAEHVTHVPQWWIYCQVTENKQTSDVFCVDSAAGCSTTGPFMTMGRSVLVYGLPPIHRRLYAGKYTAHSAMYQDYDSLSTAVSSLEKKRDVRGGICYKLPLPMDGSCKKH